MNIDWKIVGRVVLEIIGILIAFASAVSFILWMIFFHTELIGLIPLIIIVILLGINRYKFLRDEKN